MKLFSTLPEIKRQALSTPMTDRRPRQAATFTGGLLSRGIPRASPTVSNVFRLGSTDPEPMSVFNGVTARRARQSRGDTQWPVLFALRERSKQEPHDCGLLRRWESQVGFGRFPGVRRRHLAPHRLAESCKRNTCTARSAATHRKRVSRNEPAPRSLLKCARPGRWSIRRLARPWPTLPVRGMRWLRN
jgi:hypothetical protein